MKKIIAIFITSTFFMACTNVDTANVSSITYFPIITVTGANPFFVAQGSTYVDPGAVAKAGSTIVPTVTTAEGKYRGATTLDTSKTDEYLLTYSATNSDGFVGLNSRKVIVYKTGDLVNDIQGVYTSTVKRNGVFGAVTANYQNIKYIHIWKNTDGTYGISDACFGWYEYGRAFGVSYITPGGKISAVSIPTNDFTFPGTQTNSGFGGSSKITGLTVDPVAKKIVISATWITGASTFLFVATLTQVQL